MILLIWWRAPSRFPPWQGAHEQSHAAGAQIAVKGPTVQKLSAQNNFLQQVSQHSSPLARWWCDMSNVTSILLFAGRLTHENV
jgi:hypothetical protein